MRIFLDTNVILEYFLDREDGKTAGQLFTFFAGAETLAVYDGGELLHDDILGG